MESRDRGEFRATSWELELNTARAGAKFAAEELFAEFGTREINCYRGRHDVQLKADLKAQEIIMAVLVEEFPDYGIVAEELAYSDWPDSELTWVIDPLDGTNNFGYGIAHCAISITLFHNDEVVLALVLDPLLRREFFATADRPLTVGRRSSVRLDKATVSLATNYSDEGRVWGNKMSAFLGARCKRTVSLWAPALDLALVADGSLDAMVCSEGDLLDLCGGIFLVSSAGGCVLDLSGQEMRVHRSVSKAPISFVAAHTCELATELLFCVQSNIE